MKKGLVLVDIQNDYFPGGAMEPVSMDTAADMAALSVPYAYVVSAAELASVASS